MDFLTNLNLNKNQLQNAVIHPLATAPQSPVEGQIYYNSTDKLLYQYDGTAWKAAGAVFSVNGQTGIVVLTQDDVGDGSTYVRTHNDLTDALKALVEGALQTTGGTMSGAIAMGSNKITGLADGSAATDAATFGQIPTASSATPEMDGTASAGSATTWAKGDHVHPTDTSRMAANLKGAANGVAELDANGKVPTSQLPSYVDDVEEYSSQSSFPATGETGKIYVATDTNLTYRWSGSAYVEISPSLALGETSSTAYAGDKGKEAHDLASAALPKAGGTMTGAIAMGSNKITGLSNGTASGDAVNYDQLTGLIKTATGTIGTTGTSAEVSFTGTFINAYATMGGAKVEVDMDVASNKVTFSTGNSPSSTVTCVVVYA